jgi:dynactin complex subunit
MKNEETASGRRPSLPEVAVALQDSSSATTKINLSVDEERSRLQEEHRRLKEEVRQKEDELKKLEDESIKTLNSAFTFLQRFSEVIEADDFIEDSRRRIHQARAEDRVRVIRDVLRSTSALMDVIDSRRREQ